MQTELIRSLQHRWRAFDRRHHATITRLGAAAFGLMYLALAYVCVMMASISASSGIGMILTGLLSGGIAALCFYLAFQATPQETEIEGHPHAA